MGLVDLWDWFDRGAGPTAGLGRRVGLVDLSDWFDRGAGPTAGLGRRIGLIRPVGLVRPRGWPDMWGGGHTKRVQPRYWVRAFVNIINCSTLLGLIAAVLGRARLTRGHHGLILGWGYQFRIPPRRTPAFTLGNVVLLRHEGPEILQRRPTLLIHEERHSTQYAYCLGVVMVALYGLAAAWSWLRTGDPASRNIFERLAGLADGGYTEHPVRPLFGRSRRVRRPTEVSAAWDTTAAPETTTLPKTTTVPETTAAPGPAAATEMAASTEAPPAPDRLP